MGSAYRVRDVPLKYRDSRNVAHEFCVHIWMVGVNGVPRLWSDPLNGGFEFVRHYVTGTVNMVHREPEVVESVDDALELLFLREGLRHG